MSITTTAKVKRALVQRGIIALAITIAMTLFYRPWIYSNGYYDIHLADTIGSLGGSFMATMLLPGFFCPEDYPILRAGVGSAIGALVYEFIQPLIGTGVFDIADVFASVIGGVTGILVILRVVKVTVDKLETVKNCELIK